MAGFYKWRTDGNAQGGENIERRAKDAFNLDNKYYPCRRLSADEIEIFKKELDAKLKSCIQPYDGKYRAKM